MWLGGKRASGGVMGVRDLRHGNQDIGIQVNYAG